MEAIERVDKQRDSFEEVDRILTIVEESKKELDKVASEKLSRTLNGLYFPLSLSAIGFLYSLYGMTIYKQVIMVYTFACAAAVLLFSSTYLLYTMPYNKKLAEKKKLYNATNYQAIEILREIIPVVSRKENWSALQKFELRLRLSKLDINPDSILADRHL